MDFTSNLLAGCGPIDKCKICIVAGYPSNTEINTKSCFTGRQADLLKDLLTTGGVMPSQVYYTNVIKERCTTPAKWLKFGKTNITPSPEYIQAEAALKEELSACSANVFLPIDNIALYALTRETSVDKFRSSILHSTLLEGKRKVIPTLSPASAWRNYLFRHFILHDIIRARKESVFPETHRPQYELITEPTFEECIDYIKQCNDASLIGYDIETAKLQLDCFSLALSPTSSICIPIVAKGTPYWSLEQEAEILLALARLLANPSCTKVLQNGNYDATFMYERYGMLTHPVEDTMIAQGLLFPDFPKSLAFLCSTYTNHPYYKDDGKQRFKGYLTDDESFWRYSALDSLTTLEVWHRLKADLESEGHWPTYRSHIDILDPIQEMQLLGCPMDVEGMKAEETQTDLRIEKLKLELNEVVGHEINPASPKQLMEYFYGPKAEGGLGIKPYLSNGKPTTDVTAMARLSRRGFPAAKIIMDIRKLAKFNSTYLKTTLRPNSNILSCSYNPIGTKTGRLASSSTIFNHGANRQNQPKEMKKFMLCRPYRVCYTIDLSAAENRIVANYGPVPPMAEAFENGEDVHAKTASLLYGMPITEVSRASGSANIPNSSKSQRDMGKMFNHSGNYGVGYKTLALKTDTPEGTIRPLLMRYHQIYPEVEQRFQAGIKAQLQENRIVTNLLGRKRKFMDRWGDTMFNEAFAQPAQSTIADIINRRGLAFMHHTPSISSYTYLTNQVHDSIEFEIPLQYSWHHHASILLQIIASLETPLEAHSTKFVIPCDLEMRRHNYANSMEVPVQYDNVDMMAAHLHWSWACLN